MFGRVLKGRYFRHGPVLQARLGNNPSYIWRSLLWSKDILVKGLIWRVGDGKNINIYNDRWIPSMQDTLGDATAPRIREHSVSSLIRNGGWDIALITASFNPYIAGEILKIPLNNAGAHDSFFWKYDVKGRYTVRDGCRLQRGFFMPPTHQSVHPNEDWWSFIWNLSIPPKIRIFWWSFSHDCIPTNQNLYRHHVPVTESCSLCNFSMDSTSHALFFCAAIKHLWKNTMFIPVLRGGSHSCTMELCMWFKEQLSKADFEIFATHTWAVWRERQKAIHREKQTPLAADVTWSFSLLSDFHKAKNKVKVAGILPNGNPEKNWTPPRHSAVKLNVDAALDEKRHQFSIGGVARDNQGRLLLAFGKQINQPLSVVHGELLAIQEGVLLIYDKGFTDVQVASDSLLAVQAVTTDLEDLGYMGLCATAIKERLKRPAISDCIHVYRSSNKVAHNIARFAFSSPSPFVWLNGEFSSWLVNLVMDDLIQ